MMTVARSVGDVLAKHVVFEVDCVDRMYCNVYVPQLQYAVGLIGYLQRQLGLPIASTAPLAKITDAFSTAVHRFARDHGLPWVDFAKGQRKDDVAHEHLARFIGTEGVLFVGRAQEKTPLFRTEKRRDGNGDCYPWIVTTTGLVNHFYFYCYDDDFGPFFLKFCSYFPYNAKLCINGNHWAQRQAAKAGIAFEPLDNGFAAVEDPAALQAICDRLGPEQIDALLRKWLAILPHPFSTEDRAAGYRYDISILQAEFSLDPDAGQTRLGSGLFRAGHPRQPRHRPPRPGCADLRPAADASRATRDTRPVPHQGDHRRSHPEPARGLQAHPNQAIPQTREGVTDRDHDQRHHRLRDRQTAD